MEQEMSPLTGIFDSHAHYDAEQFDPDRAGLLSTVLPDGGVCGVINMGADLKGCFDTVTLTQEYDYFYGAVGIHPECAGDLPKDWLLSVKKLLCKDKIVAVGEIGLDYHYLDMCPKDRQKEVFCAQLALANETGKPVVIHDREAHGDILDILREYKPQGVLHCFSGSVETAREVIGLGLSIGLGGVVTFKNARHAVEVAKEIPLERLLLETDAPYMAPVPFRGKRNDSTLIAHVARTIAGLRDISAQEVIDTTRENAKRLFCIT